MVQYNISHTGSTNTNRAEIESFYAHLECIHWYFEPLHLIALILNFQLSQILMQFFSNLCNSQVQVQVHHKSRIWNTFAADRSVFHMRGVTVLAIV